jgi:branched-chain amino acid transport system permease protein
MTLGLFTQILVNGLIMGGIYAMVASGFTLTLGVVKIFNFAQGQFYMLGAYVCFGVVTALGMPYPVALLASFVSMFLLGALFYFGVIHKTLASGFFHTWLITVSFGTIIGQGALLTFGNKAGVMPAVIEGAYNIGGVIIPQGKLLVIGGAIIIMVALYYFMRTKIGTSMLAAAENVGVAGLMGINATQVFWVTTAVGCALCGFAGGLIAPVFAASLFMGQTILMKALFVVMVGGMGSMSGALIAAFLVGIAESFGFQYVGQWDLILIFGFIAVLLYFKPGGLIGKPLPLPGE